jgi:predicted RecB family nuclease
MSLSKSKFMSGLQCPKRLWWEMREPQAPELAITPEQRFRFDRGHEVGRLARTYVPGGVSIEAAPGGRERRLRQTAEAIRSGAPAVYEAAFEHGGVMVVADILERDGGGWNLIEVKSSTAVKAEHLPDVAVQAHVLRGAGLEVRRASLMHLNRDCRHPDLTNLFTRADLTPAVEDRLRAVPAEIAAMQEVLRGPRPEAEVGERCSRPYECPFWDRCWPPPRPHAIETLYRVDGEALRRLQERGITTLLELPDDEPLSEIQARQREAVRRDGPVVAPGLAGALAAFQPPYAYLDFETVSPPIPVWPGCRPYDQVPVQMSVHREDGGGLAHFEWLADGPGDPREEAARRLLEFTAGARTIFAYYAPFERQRIEELEAALPHLAADLAAVREHVADLLPLVRDFVYHPRFEGRFGLKHVAPVLAPEIDYAGLEVAEGGAATRLLFDRLFGSGSGGGGERVRRDLLAYCRTDTEALVALHRTLVRLSAPPPPPTTPPATASGQLLLPGLLSER